jgi:hypothetical protein
MKTLFISMVISCMSLVMQQVKTEPDSYVVGRIVVVVGVEREGIFEAQVELLKDGTDLKGRTKTDADGYFRIGPVDAGRYTLRISSPEIPEGTKLIENIPMKNNMTIAMGDIVVSYPEPMGCPRIPTKQKENGRTILTKDEIIRMPYHVISLPERIKGEARSYKTIPVYRLTKYDSLMIIAGPIVPACCGRSCPNVYYVNGIRISDLPSIPEPPVKVRSILNGIPAEYENSDENNDTRSNHKIFQRPGVKIQSNVFPHNH